ncbi:MAG TPA: 16S rRNA (cytosine(967)-C(5))-methyltransferase RsmB, partial [Clostridia bacterium]|nr:16S rRNA (cytosine(967)-C(5))-methyltransferase RsmB [Clostridia bacterium]
MSVRRRALEALRDVTEKGAYANLRLKQAAAGLPARDAAWVTAAVYTALDHLAYIDLAISAYAKGKLDKAVLAVLRLGIAQAEFMDTPKSAACDESVRLVKEIGKAALAGYVNAVMRAVCANGMPSLPGEPRERLAVAFGYPRWLVDEYADMYGLDFTEKLMSSKPGGFTVRAQYPYTARELETSLTGRGMAFRRGTYGSEAFILEKGFDVANDPLFLEGKLAVQSEGAMLACRAALPKPGMRILDCCAAPGGKSAYLASLMGNEGSIEAWELHEHRAKLTEKTLARLNASIVKVARRDATAFDERYADSFDAVLIDAPCSGFGLTGKPDVRYAKTSEAVDGLARTQKELLDVCSRYVRPGGRLVYATCTISARENGAQAERFLAEHTDFAPAADWL